MVYLQLHLKLLKEQFILIHELFKHYTTAGSFRREIHQNNREKNQCDSEPLDSRHFSPNNTKAIVTETGSSRDETILPKPNPALGKPILNKIGGIIVPNNARIKPYFHKIEYLKA